MTTSRLRLPPNLQKVYFFPAFLDQPFMRGYNLHNLCSKVDFCSGRIRLCESKLAGAGPGCAGDRAAGRRLREGLPREGERGEGKPGRADEDHQPAGARRRAHGGEAGRLARSTRDLLNLLASISERGASFRSLRDTWADTTNAHGRLIITVLAGLAEFERELIRSRCGEGMARAKERGVRFGRPPKLTPHQRREARARLEAGETQSDIARSYNVDATTIGRLAR
jgi:hypothetical protein